MILLPYSGLRAYAVSNGLDSKAALAKTTGEHRAQFIRWEQAGGLAEVYADRVACALGAHPVDIWPVEWRAIEEDRFEAKRAHERKLAAARKRKERKLNPERAKAQWSAYYADCSEAIKAKKRADYWKDPETHREARTARRQRAKGVA